MSVSLQSPPAPAARAILARVTKRHGPGMRLHLPDAWSGVRRQASGVRRLSPRSDRLAQVACCAWGGLARKQESSWAVTPAHNPRTGRPDPRQRRPGRRDRSSGAPSRGRTSRTGTPPPRPARWRALPADGLDADRLGDSRADLGGDRGCLVDPVAACPADRLRGQDPGRLQAPEFAPDDLGWPAELARQLTRMGDDARPGEECGKDLAPDGGRAKQRLDSVVHGSMWNRRPCDR